MHLETNSYLGPTTNPYNRVEISAGGSSGGEGALIAMKGSPLGIGTDIGGSIRSVRLHIGFEPNLTCLTYYVVLFLSLLQRTVFTVSNRRQVFCP